MNVVHDRAHFFKAGQIELWANIQLGRPFRRLVKQASEASYNTRWSS